LPVGTWEMRGWPGWPRAVQNFQLAPQELAQNL
jgi:hypothetical protein